MKIPRLDVLIPDTESPGEIFGYKFYELSEDNIYAWDFGATTNSQWDFLQTSCATFRTLPDAILNAIKDLVEDFDEFPPIESAMLLSQLSTHLYGMIATE